MTQMYTTAEVQEVMKCMNSFDYFVKNYLSIEISNYVDIPSQRIYQNIDLSYENQIAYILWYSIFHNDRTVLFLSDKTQNALIANLLFHELWSDLPAWLRPKVKEDRKDCIRFDNGCYVLFRPLTEMAGRGMAISLLMINRYHEVDKAKRELFMHSIVPCIATGGNLVLQGHYFEDKNES